MGAGRLVVGERETGKQLSSLAAPANGRIEVPELVAADRRDALAQLVRIGYKRKELHVKEPDSVMNPPSHIALDFVVGLAAHRLAPVHIAEPIVLVRNPDGKVMLSVHEKVEGQTLESLLRGASAIESSAYAEELVRIVSFLHSGGAYAIYHGDPNPTNVIMTPQGTLKLVDPSYCITIEMGQAMDWFTLAKGGFAVPSGSVHKKPA